MDNKMWCTDTMEYYSATRKNKTGSVLVRWMNLEPIIQNEVSQKEKDQYHILMHVYRIYTDSADEPICRAAIEKPT